MTVERVVGARRFAVLAGGPDLGGMDAQVLQPVRIELSLGKGNEVVIATDGPRTVHLIVEDWSDTLVIRLGKPDGQSGLGSSADPDEAYPHRNPRLDVWA
ncbi:MAG TPA: hypothetical protein VF443_10905 [Nitrospira sp.]